MHPIGGDSLNSSSSSSPTLSIDDVYNANDLSFDIESVFNEVPVPFSHLRVVQSASKQKTNTTKSCTFTSSSPPLAQRTPPGLYKHDPSPSSSSHIQTYSSSPDTITSHPTRAFKRDEATPLECALPPPRPPGSPSSSPTSVFSSTFTKHIHTRRREDSTIAKEHLATSAHAAPYMRVIPCRICGRHLPNSELSLYYTVVVEGKDYLQHQPDVRIARIRIPRPRIWKLKKDQLSVSTPAQKSATSNGSGMYRSIYLSIYVSIHPSIFVCMCG